MSMGSDLESVILALGEISRSPEDAVVVNMDEIERENEVKQETTIQPMRDIEELCADPKAEGKGKSPGNRIFGLDIGKVRVTSSRAPCPCSEPNHNCAPLEHS